jgi:hypothetical protein
MAHVLDREITTIAVALPRRITKVFYTPGTREKRPGGTRKEASGSQYCDIVKRLAKVEQAH